MKLQPWFNAEVALDAVASKSDHARLLVSNHRSHLDAFILLSRVPGVRIFAKSALFNVPFLGLMMRASRQIPVKRGRIEAFWKAIETVRTRLQNGETVHVFPEMTRCAPGTNGTLEFSTAPFLTAMQTGTPVTPIVFKGTDGVWPKGAWGLAYRQPVTARALEALDPSAFESADALKHEAQRRIAAELAL
jgi:1-acyl-sn-glycerol-3-phosphate acyltransferase